MTDARAEKIAEAGAGQVLYYPLILPNSGFTGVVGVVLPEARPLRVHQSALVQAIIQQGAVAFMHGTLYEQTVSHETQMQAILESSRDGIILVSPEQNVHYLNRRAIELLNLDDRASSPWDVTVTELIEVIDEEVPDLADGLLRALPDAPFSLPAAADGEMDTPVFTRRRFFLLHAPDFCGT
ncbi:MAG: PAS domain-containing protein [Anaerolineae bacterium]